MLRPVDNSERRNYNFVDHTDYDGIADKDIIRSILEGKTQLFEVLMRRYNQRLYRIQCSYLDDEEAVKDALQTTYIKAFQKLEQFRGEAQFSTWLTRIAINEALKLANRNKRYQNMHVAGEPASLKQEPSDDNRTPEEMTIRADLRSILEETVSDLPPKYRSVYLMREVEQMSTKETATCLDISRSNVKVRLHRAKQKLRDSLEKKVSDTDIFNFLGVRCDNMVYAVMKQLNTP